MVSLPLTANGMSRPEAFLAGTLCGAVEPVGAVLMVAITGLVTPLLPYCYLRRRRHDVRGHRGAHPQTQGATQHRHHRRRLRLRARDGASMCAGVGGGCGRF